MSKEKSAQFTVENTHTLIDVPNFGKVWVVRDISVYAQALATHIEETKAKHAAYVIGNDETFKNPPGWSIVQRTTDLGVAYKNLLRQEQRKRAGL